MSNEVIISKASACTSPKSTDLVVLASANASSNTGTGYETKNATISNLTKNIICNTIIVNQNTTLEDNSSVGYTRGQMWFDDTHLYVVVSNTEIKRVTLESF